jgi:hypothetical protein
MRQGNIICVPRSCLRKLIFTCIYVAQDLHLPTSSAGGYLATCGNCKGSRWKIISYIIISSVCARASKKEFTFVRFLWAYIVSICWNLPYHKRVLLLYTKHVQYAWNLFEEQLFVVGYFCTWIYLIFYDSSRNLVLDPCAALIVQLA